ncbi:MAG: CheR family methyltransferase [Bacteroidota bacterium]
MGHADGPAAIVGIGASAGGVKALQQFFAHVPVDSGIAYIVILHLSPDHDSKLAEVLRTSTSLKVQQVKESVIVAANNVYVIAPDKHLTMEDGTLAVSANMHIEDRRAPVDIFFRTLAESHGPKAIAVVLSGTGANGSMGLKRVKERGGAVYVQNPREAEYSEMPRNSIATELVDEVLPVADIPRKILLYKNNLGQVRIPEEPEQRPDDLQHALREIFTQLRVHTGHDFSNYKRATLLRRIERRISMRNMPDLPAYATYLQNDPDETTALLKDLLISVTNFFRDKEAFDALEQHIIPAIVKGKSEQEAVRIWVPGCATGEEAYSIAMLCAEHAVKGAENPKIQIFGTDIDDAAIAQAREGLYTINDAADVSPERLRRFFTKEGDYYRVTREIREMILFANHNFIKDPPFSRLNMISCRNVLIYLNRTAQDRVMETFHFALSPGGYLFLGSSETAEGAGDLYAVAHREAHIFQARQVGMRPLPVPERLHGTAYEQPKTALYAREQGACGNRAADLWRSASAAAGAICATISSGERRL